MAIPSPPEPAISPLLVHANRPPPSPMIAFVFPVPPEASPLPAGPLRRPRASRTSRFSRRSAVAAIGSGPSIWMQLEAQRRISRPFLALHEPLGDRGAKKSATLCQEKAKSTVRRRRGWNRRQGPPGANGSCRESDGRETRLAAAFADCCLQILHSQCSLCTSARVKSCQPNAGGVFSYSYRNASMGPGARL